MRVQQRDWDSPVCKEWMETLENTVSRLGSDVVLVAHSLACLLVAHWVASHNPLVRRALLVSPPNPDGPHFPKQALGFSPPPLLAFPFPTIVVASTNDPYGSIEFAKSVASAWGSRFICIGAAGHINSKSGLGEWPDGFAYWKQLLEPLT